MRDHSTDDHLERRECSREEGHVVGTDKNEFTRQNDAEGGLVTIVEPFGYVQDKYGNEANRRGRPIDVVKQRTDQFYIEFR